jgi:hypothetical protein
MSEYADEPGFAPEGHESEQVAAIDEETMATGVPAVDEVLATVQELEGRPVDEHVAVFEQAHERLRRALDPGHG